MEEVKLGDLKPGMLFKFQDTYAIKSEYQNEFDVCECIIVGTGEMFGRVKYTGTELDNLWVMPIPIEQYLNEPPESEWEKYANLMKDSRDHWEGEYSRAYGKFLTERIKTEDLRVENNKLKNTLKELHSIEEPIDLEYLITIEKSYGQLISENAELIHFKEVATKYLTAEQLEEIEEEMQNPPETNY